MMNRLDDFDSMPRPDWWSRMMAVGSLLVAAAALWFARNGIADPAAVGTGDTDVAALVSKLETEVAASEGRQKQFNQMIGQLERVTNYRPNSSADPGAEGEGDSSMGDKASSAPSEDTVAADIPPTTVTSGVTNDLLPEPDAAEQQSVTAEIDDNETAGNGDTDLNDDLKLGSYGELIQFADEDDSILKTLDTRLRPMDEESAAAVTIRNESSQPAIITHIKFEPTEVLDGIPTELAIDPVGESTNSDLVVAYDASENTSRDPADQGTYYRRLQTAYIVPPNEQINIRLAVKNADHIGYALQGKLTLEFNTTETKSIKDVVAIFVGRPDPT